MPNNSSNSTLIFVYNAKGGFFNGVSDYIHKFVSPSTYKCNLCAVTYDNLGMKKLWKTYISNLGIQTLFLHNDELVGKYAELKNLELPCILIQTQNETKMLIDSQTLNSLSTQELLIQKLDAELERYL